MVLRRAPETNRSVAWAGRVASRAVQVKEEKTELFPAAKEAMDRRRMLEEAKRARQLQSQLNNGDAAPT